MRVNKSESEIECEIEWKQKVSQIKRSGHLSYVGLTITRAIRLTPSILSKPDARPIMPSN